MSSTHVFLTLVLASGCCMWTTQVSAIQFNFNFNFKQWMPMHSTTARPQPSQCKDLKDTCPEWHYFGYCDNPEYETYMTIYCNKSCNKCTWGNRIQPRIVGGNEATPHSHPYIASLQAGIFTNFGTEFTHICGATLIKPNWLLTAAHCVVIVEDDYDEDDDYVDEWSVVLGTNKGRDPTGEAHQRLIVERIIPHPYFKEKRMRTDRMKNDIALLKLRTAANINEYVEVAEMALSDDVAGENCIFAGWGYDKAGHGETPPSGEPNQLRELSMVVVPYRRCDDFYSNLEQTHLCAKAKDTGSPCSEDSGGPLMCGGYLTGLSSEVQPSCEGESPSIFTRVSAFKTWINSEIKKYNG